MTFTSWEFARFVLVVVAVVSLLRGPTVRLLALLVASVVFYAWGQPTRLALLALPIVVDFVSALRMAALPDRRARRPWLALSVVTDIGLLAWFKWAAFESVHAASPAAPALGTVLPLGLSFFTLKSLSYAVDVYRGAVVPCRSLWRYALFIAWFPALVAGPIARAAQFLPQLARTLRPTPHRAFVGVQLILLGLTKKLVIADQLATLTDAVFTWPQEFSPLTVASGVVAYSLQIYCDFSGYTDMALGVSHVLGVDLPPNFALPYLATSLTDFWRRWHITLSSWLRDYVYVPLGGNRHGRARTFVNLWITMLVGGLWHGIAPTFLVWGAWHAAGLCIDKQWREWTRDRWRPLAGVGGWLLTYVFVTVGWIFFRAPSLDVALVILAKLAGRLPDGVAWLYSPFVIAVALVVAAHVIAANVVPALRAHRSREAMISLDVERAYFLLPGRGFATGFVLTAWLLVVFVFSAVATSPFIYFQF